ncbi:MAG: 2-phospho-L-lactate transferase [Methanomicrobiaceae archaeon]|nr:2-phospho-L-lactate transferase [Methanomicrobiaceae archaeon]
MITFLSGGTGTPKLIRGMRAHVDDSEIAVVVNTAEDMWLSGNHLSPDIDTVLYLFAGTLNTETWWGIRGDTFLTHDELLRLGEEEYIAVGDRDRAVHIARAAMLKRGESLTHATARLADSMGVCARILPMADTQVATWVGTDAGPIHFQEYWVKYRGKRGITEVTWRYETPPEATREVLDAIRSSDAVIIGPSNPITSIGPILGCEGVREELQNQYVIAVSPFIGNEPLSGPAKALMEACGYEPNSADMHRLYEDFCDIVVQDIRDPVRVKGSVRLDTIMTDEGKSRQLAGEILSLVRKS